MHSTFLFSLGVSLLTAHLNWTKCPSHITRSGRCYVVMLSYVGNLISNTDSYQQAWNKSTDFTALWAPNEIMHGKDFTK